MLSTANTMVWQWHLFKCIRHSSISEIHPSVIAEVGNDKLYLVNFDLRPLTAKEITPSA